MSLTPEEEEKLLLEPYKYVTQLPGKGVRSKLLRAFNHWMRIPEDKVGEIGTIVQMLHNASLLIGKYLIFFKKNPHIFLYFGGNWFCQK